MGFIVGPGAVAAAQDNVGVGVARGLKDRGHALLGHRGEPVWLCCGAYCIDRDLHVTAGAVFETDGHGKAGGEFAVNLALGRACTDGRPGDGVGNELRNDGVKELRAGRQAQLADVDQ